MKKSNDLLLRVQDTQDRRHTLLLEGKVRVVKQLPRQQDPQKSPLAVLVREKADSSKK